MQFSKKLKIGHLGRIDGDEIPPKK